MSYLSAFSLAAFWKAANVSEAAARDLPPRARAPGVTGVPTRLDQPYRGNGLISDIFKVMQTVKNTVDIQEPEMEFLVINLTKDSSFVLHAIRSPRKS